MPCIPYQREHSLCAHAELNVRSMKEWQKLGSQLAEFPGTLYLGDARDNDPRYPSRKLTQQEALNLQPGLAPEAASSGAVLYEQEGVLINHTQQPEHKFAPLRDIYRLLFYFTPIPAPTRCVHSRSFGIYAYGLCIFRVM